MVEKIVLSMVPMTPTRLRYAMVAMALAITSVPAWAAFAQTSVPAQQTSQPTSKAPAKPDIGSAPSGAELDRFAHAAVQVGNIKRTAGPEIEAASSKADRAKLEQATVKRIKTAIRSHHLSVHRYLQIIAYVQAHPAEQQKVVALMRQLMPPLPPQQPLPGSR